MRPSQLSHTRGRTSQRDAADGHLLISEVKRSAIRNESIALDDARHPGPRFGSSHLASCCVAAVVGSGESEAREPVAKLGLWVWLRRRVWLRSFALLVILGVLWVVATPALGAPDEGSHVIRAWSVAHGQLLGHDKGPVFREVTGPVVYRNLLWYAARSTPRTRARTASRSGPALALDLPSPTPAATSLRTISPLGSRPSSRSPGMVQLDLMRFVSVLLAAAL